MRSGHCGCGSGERCSVSSGARGAVARGDGRGDRSVPRRDPGVALSQHEKAATSADLLALKRQLSSAALPATPAPWSLRRRDRSRRRCTEQHQQVVGARPLVCVGVLGVRFERRQERSRRGARHQPRGNSRLAVSPPAEPDAVREKFARAPPGQVRQLRRDAGQGYFPQAP